MNIIIIVNKIVLGKILTMYTIEDQIKDTLDKIRPFIQRDGGDVTFDSFVDGIVYVNVSGACDGCAMLNETIEAGVGILLKEEVPGVLDVRLSSEKPITEEDIYEENIINDIDYKNK